MNLQVGLRVWGVSGLTVPGLIFGVLADVQPPRLGGRLIVTTEQSWGGRILHQTLSSHGFASRWVYPKDLCAYIVYTWALKLV